MTKGAPITPAPELRPADIVACVAQARIFVSSRYGDTIAELGGSLDDVMQDVAVRIIRASQSPRSRWDPRRGLSLSSWVYEVGTSVASNYLRSLRRRCSREQGIAEAPERGCVPAPERAPMGSDLERVMALLDLPEEKQMATHLAAGCTLADTQRAMGLSYDRAAELRTRVRALLVCLVHEEQ